MEVIAIAPAHTTSYFLQLLFIDDMFLIILFPQWTGKTQCSLLSQILHKSREELMALIFGVLHVVIYQ